MDVRSGDNPTEWRKNRKLKLENEKEPERGIKGWAGARRLSSRLEGEIIWRSGAGSLIVGPHKQVAAKTKRRAARYPLSGRTAALKLKETSQGILLPPDWSIDASQKSGLSKVNGGFADSAFSDNKLRPIHRWVPWIAGFSAEFVQDAFARYLPPNSNVRAVVLDPFCGVGTTLIEAMRCGHDAVGFEINPYAALAATAKCQAADIAPEQVGGVILKFQQHMSRAARRNGTAAVPEYFRSRIPFFGSHAQAKVLKAVGFIQHIEPKNIQDLFWLAFGSVMVSLSNYSYEPSLSSRPAAGKSTQDDAPVAEAILTKLLAMKSDVSWFRAELDRFEPRSTGRVITESFLKGARQLRAGSVDLIVTSPPYLNNYHYVRNTRPQLFWLGFIKKASELKGLENQNFGKYWQTVRDLESVPLDFEHPGLEGLLEKISKIGLDRGTYGGPGWANYAVTYFNDMNRFCCAAEHVLRPQGRAVVVVGNSILQGVEIPIDNILADLASRHNLVTENIHIVRQKRVGASIVASSVRQGAKSTARLYESAVVLRRI